MNNFKYSWLLLTVLLFTSCQTISKKKLLGTWLAVELYEEDVYQDIDLSSAAFTFNEDGTYLYENTEFLREAGHFELRGSVVVTTDTLDPVAQKKAVEIIYLDRDSLHFEMNADGKRQVLKLIKYEEGADDTFVPEEESIEEAEESSEDQL